MIRKLNHCTLTASLKILMLPYRLFLIYFKQFWESILELHKEFQRIQEDCEYSAKGHFESAKYWRIWNYWLMIVSIISVCACLALTFSDWDKMWIGAIGLISSLATILLIFLNPQEKYLSHQNSGNDYIALRNEARIFLEYELSKLNEDDLIAKIKELNSKRDTLNKHSLPILESAYKNAKHQIEVQKTAQYRVDKDEY